MSDIFNDKNVKKKVEQDEKMKELHSKWTREQEFLLAEWAEKASCYRWLHGRSEKNYQRWYYSFSIPGCNSMKFSACFALATIFFTSLNRALAS